MPLQFKEDENDTDGHDDDDNACANTNTIAARSIKSIAARPRHERLTNLPRSLRPMLVEQGPSISYPAIQEGQDELLQCQQHLVLKKSTISRTQDGCSIQRWEPRRG